MSFPTILALLFYPAVMVHAGIGDLRTMRIPNRVVLLLLAGYLVAIPLVGLTLPDVAWSFAAAAVVFALGLVGFSFGWMGGGDVKLLAVATLWLGAGNVAPLVFYTSVFGAILTILLLIFRALSLPVALQQHDWVSRLHQRDEGVPYGVAIAAAGNPCLPGYTLGRRPVCKSAELWCRNA